MCILLKTHLSPSLSICQMDAKFKCAQLRLTPIFELCSTVLIVFLNDWTLFGEAIPESAGGGKEEADAQLHFGWMAVS